MASYLDLPPRPPSILAVFTGAGLSAESGIPTFRLGKDALWEGHRIEQVCDFASWKDNRDAVHHFYNARRVSAALAEPNEAHRTLARWQTQWGTSRVVLVTQNVDDLLERAGATEVCHVHGRLNWMLCTACRNKWYLGPVAWDPYKDVCPKCSSRKGVKPEVVFFHEEAPEYVRMHKIIKNLRGIDSAVVMGTSCQVVPFDFLLGPSPCWKAINSLDPSEEMGNRVQVFDMVLGMPATEAVKKLEPLLEERMKDAVA